MKYLDYSVMRSVLNRFFGEEKTRQSRLVGPPRQFESDYFDIVRFFGGLGVDPSEVKIKRLARPFEFKDEHIARFSEWAEEELRRDGRLYRGSLATRVTEADFGSAAPAISIQPCDYGRQAGSCFALDLPHEEFDGGTLRQYYLDTYTSRDIDDNPLAICLGVCGLLLTNEQDSPSVLLVRRAAHLASLEDSIGPSAAGSIDWDEHSANLLEMIRSSLGDEIREELELHENQYTLTPLAWAREVFRGERPQVFCLIRVDMSGAELDSHMAGTIEASDEIASYALAGLEDGLPPQTGSWGSLNPEARMNWLLLSEWLAEQH